MQRFIVEQNLVRFRKLLTQEADRNLRRALQSMIFSTQRELALFNSTSSGVSVLPPGSALARINDYHGVSQFQREFESSSHPYLILDPWPASCWARLDTFSSGLLGGDPPGNRGPVLRQGTGPHKQPNVAARHGLLNDAVLGCAEIFGGI